MNEAEDAVLRWDSGKSRYTYKHVTVHVGRYTLHVGQYIVHVGQSFVTLAQTPLQLSRRHLSKTFTWLELQPRGEDVLICKILLKSFG